MNVKWNVILSMLSVTVAVVFPIIVNNYSVAKTEKVEATANKEILESINNDLKLIQHIVKHAKNDAIKTFNNSKPIPQGRFKAKDSTPLGIYDGLVDVDSLIIDIEEQLKIFDCE